MLGCRLPLSVPAWLFLVVLLLLGRTARAADFMIDGVPLPGDTAIEAAAEPPANHPAWSGAWVGVWGGQLKHILVVEHVTADGHASVIYAYGDSPAYGIRRAWSRHQATISAQTLTIAGDFFSADYEMTPAGRLRATYRRGGIVSLATMTRADFASISKHDAVMQWTGGVSDLLATDLVEDGRPVRLEVVTFRPPGDGPFPLAVVNHGSTGRGTDPALFGETWVDTDLADFLTRRGWMVAFPQRRGRGRSDGLYDEGFDIDRTQGYTCDPGRSIPGANRALGDIAAAVTAIRRRSDVARSRILMVGQSRGGILSIAYAGAHPDEVLGVINFVGGWMGMRCATASRINGTLFERGAPYGRPTLWLYGRHDPFYSIEHSQENFELFRKAGGQGTFLTFDVPGGNGHHVMGAEALWSKPVAAYLDAVAAAGRR